METEKEKKEENIKETVKVGKKNIELPITYNDADIFSAAFTVSAKKLAEILPSPKFKPMITYPGRAVMIVAAMNYRETGIGPYLESYITFPVYYRAYSLPVLSPIFEMRWPGAGMFVLQSYTNKNLVVEAGRQIWKYPKEFADIEFTDKPGIYRIELFEKGGKDKILEFAVRKAGRTERYTMGWRTYSIDQGKMYTTEIDMEGVRRVTRLSKTAEIHFTDHAACETLRALEPSPSPVLSSYFLHIRGALPKPQKEEPFEP